MYCYADMVPFSESLTREVHFPRIATARLPLASHLVSAVGESDQVAPRPPSRPPSRSTCRLASLGITRPRLEPPQAALFRRTRPLSLSPRRGQPKSTVVDCVWAFLVFSCDAPLKGLGKVGGGSLALAWNLQAQDVEGGRTWPTPELAGWLLGHGALVQ